MCSGFSCDGVHFFSEAGAGLCFGFRIVLITHWWFGLPSSAYPKPRNFQWLMLCHEGSAKKAGREHGQRDIPSHRGPCPVYKLGELPRRGADHGSGWVWQHSAGDEQLYNASSFSFKFYFSPFLLLFLLLLHIIIIIIILILYFNKLQLLNCSYLNLWVLLFFLILLIIPPGWG